MSPLTVLAPIIARAEELRATGADAVDAAVQAVTELAPGLPAGGPKMQVEQGVIDGLEKRTGGCGSCQAGKVIS